MTRIIKKMRFDRHIWFLQLGRMGLYFLVLFTTAGVSQTAQAAKLKQKTFVTPESAVESLVAVNNNYNGTKLVNILGPHSQRLVFSGDPVADKKGRKKFLDAYNVSHKIESDGDDRRILVVGKEEWPFPIPIVRSGGVWRFASVAGEQEILNRRIGRNELSVIQVCRAYVEAQREYAEQKLRVSGKLEYAPRLHSTQGKHDGLYWITKPGEEESPLGKFIASAEAEGYGEQVIQAREPYHGYFFKLLKKQGDNASGGARNYIIDNRMTIGFALIAFPAKYGNSGVMTFIINQDGIVFEKNLGPRTANIARQIAQYDPDSTWKIL